MNTDETSIPTDHFTVIVWGLVTVLGALVSLAGILIPLLLRTRSDAKQAREQVKNHHGTNLRDEADQRHHENSRKLDQIYDLTVTNTRGIATLNTQVSDLRDRMDDVEEITQERPRSD